MTKKIVATVVMLSLIIAAYFIFFAGNKSSEKKESKTALVTRVMPLHRGTLSVTVSATGTVSPINIIEIKSKASGIVEAIPIEARNVVTFHASHKLKAIVQGDTPIGEDFE